MFINHIYNNFLIDIIFFSFIFLFIFLLFKIKKLDFFINSFYELKKIDWLNYKTTFYITFIVLFVTSFISCIIWILDISILYIVSKILNYKL